MSQRTNLRVKSSHFPVRRATPQQETPLEAMFNGIAVGAGLIGTALAVAAVAMEVPIAMGAAAALAVVSAASGLKRLRMLSEQREERRSGGDRRSDPEHSDTRALAIH